MQLDLPMPGLANHRSVADETVVVHADPLLTAASVLTEKAAWEFVKRVGDPNVGGSTRQGLVTAYRQDVLRCARFLSEHGATKAALVARGSGVPNARRIMSDNYYGWFDRIGAGVYGLNAAFREISR
jgi:hypothetical protein